MAFKITPPYVVDNTPIFEKDMDDNTLGMATNNGAILLNKNLVPEIKDKVIAHEKIHVAQFKRGDLDYDKKNVYWMGKTYPRDSMNEGAKNLPWEVEAYDDKVNTKNNK